MRLRRIAAVAFATAVLGAGAPAEAAQGDHFAYFKWRLQSNTWQLGPADGCPGIVCAEWGYELDPNTGQPIPAHALNVGYHCRYATVINVQNGIPPILQPPVDQVMAAVQDAAVMAWQLYDEVTDLVPELGVEPGNRPPCPGSAPMMPTVEETRVTVNVAGNEVTIVVPPVVLPVQTS